MRPFITLLLLVSMQPFMAFAQKTDSLPVEKKAKKWYESINLRGYSQIRYNRLLETNTALGCEQCDRSWGGDGGFFMRRMRLIFFGNIHERVYLYIQPDLASSTSTTSLHFAQIRDAYFDVALDAQKEFRVRIGQSKVPFGFENMQSSQNRLPLDRVDALNSAASNERELGTFFYWAPAKTRKLFSHLVSAGLKGSGDYGVLGFGVYNGQTANRPDQNRGVHTIARASYPFQFKNGQIIEPGIQAYSGKTIVPTVTKGVRGVNDKYEYTDQRVAATFVLYPQPFGIQAEYNIGTGPEYNPANNSIEQKQLKGGYATMSYLTRIKQQVVIPFVRYQYYEGGKKHELDARSYTVNDLEIGVEWQPYPNFEFVAMYTISDRRYEDAVKPINQQSGRLLRLQAQVNF
jgi:Phosphate-selective porin O and P